MCQLPLLLKRALLAVPLRVWLFRYVAGCSAMWFQRLCWLMGDWMKPTLWLDRYVVGCAAMLIDCSAVPLRWLQGCAATWVGVFGYPLTKTHSLAGSLCAWLFRYVLGCSATGAAAVPLRGWLRLCPYGDGCVATWLAVPLCGSLFHLLCRYVG